MSAEGNAKSQLIEKFAFAILPILFSCVVYLMSSLSSLSHEVTVLNNKVSLVVSNDNKQIPNVGSELAREKLRQDLEARITSNKEMILNNEKDIAILQEQLKQLKR